MAEEKEIAREWRDIYCRRASLPGRKPAYSKQTSGLSASET